MTAERDTTRIVRSWLRADERESADRVLHTVLARLETTPQRRPFWPARRSRPMTSPTRLAIAAAAVLVVVIGAYQVLPLVSGPGGPTAPAPPSVSPPVSPTASETASSPPPLPVGSLAPGTYHFSDPTITPLPFTLTVPAGWRADDLGFVMKGDQGARTGVLFTTWIITHFYTDACRRQDALEPAPTTIEALASALSSQAGLDNVMSQSQPVGGLPTVVVRKVVPTDVDLSECTGGHLRLWPDPGPDESGGRPVFPGQTAKVFVMESEGTMFVLLTLADEHASGADLVELDQIVDSIVFG